MGHAPNILIFAIIIKIDNNRSFLLICLPSQTNTGVANSLSMGIYVSEITLQFTSAAETLVGSLLLPGPGPFPAVLLITGSGPLDRNSNCRRLKVGVSQQLAIALAERGVASLRYDKRGVGQSSGTFLSTGFYDNIADGSAALNALATRPEIDAKRVFVLGHSEGALIATALAAAISPLAGIVLLAGPARPGAEVLRWQVGQVLPSLSPVLRFVLRMLRIDIAAKVAKNHERLRSSRTDIVRMGLVRINAKWFREFLEYDPAVDLAKIRVPVCALTGEKDLQVNPDDLERMTALVSAPIETHRLADLTHLLRREAGPASLRTYKKQVKRPVEPLVVDLVIDWLLRCAAS